jgi:pSer/pThr/pTyr-binding forkhead associated (FHA) protein
MSTTPTPVPTQRFVLVGVAGPVEGLEVRVDRRTILVGRSVSCDLCLTDDQVSRRHAELTVIPHPAGVGQWMLLVQDLSSRNGVHVDGSKVGATLLDGGEQLLVGRCVFRVERRAA